VLEGLPAVLECFAEAEYLAHLNWFGRADERTRTADLLITSELLYLLSYVGPFWAQSIS
jgi:hypothetical protein